VLRATLLLSLSACGFGSPSAGGVVPEGPDAAPDAADDAPDAPALCAPDPGLLVCFSFDADPMPASIANEGAASVAAQAINVTRTPGPASGAALFNTTSQLRVPPNSAVQGIASVEAWVRIDANPAGERSGILDSEATSSPLALFYYNSYSSSPNPHVLFYIGQSLFVERTLELGTWHYLAQVCESNMLAVYLNGTRIGPATSCTPAIATTYGLQIGQNNNGNTSPGNQHLVGAIDGIRLWTRPLSAATICKTSGRTDCP
jgi:hypothetical protein